ncbi:hypothetical protein D1007_56542 [Hordeum vulgare]|nr:hypothetical protein D1007_56542 [Hordeum vulgare]
MLDAPSKERQAIWLVIELSECEPKEKVIEVARLAKLKRQQDRAVRWLKGLITLSPSSDDNNDHGASSDDSCNPPPAADAYNYVID